MTDPIKLLKDDHKKVKALFAEFESADGRSKRRIANEAITELEVHAAIEAEIFYPAMLEELKDEFVVAEAEEEHHVVHVLIAELKQMEKTDVRFEAKFTVLAENVKHHIEEEETEMLSKAAKADKALLDRLGQEMAARKAELMAESKGVKVAASA